MKRLISAALASLVLAGSISAEASAQTGYRQQPQYESRDHRGGDRNDHNLRNDRNDRRDHRWQKGERLGDYNRRYAEVDYRSRNLRAPQRGYHYVRDDRGDILLAAIATGLIVSIIASN